MDSGVVRTWRALPREGRLAVIAAGCLALTLVLPWYFVALAALGCLVYAAMHAHPPVSPTVKTEAPQAPERARRPLPPRQRIPEPQTPLGRLFAEKPAWSGGPVGPFEPAPTPRKTSKTEQLTNPLGG